MTAVERWFKNFQRDYTEGNSENRVGKMMIRWLKPLFLLIGLICIPLAAAQDAIAVPEQPLLTARCVPLSEAPTNWTFEGTIITFQEHEGVYGFRADTPSRYYIAFDKGNQFAGSGTFSPDGQWFAYFGAGRQQYANMHSRHVSTSHVIVVSTHPRQETYLMPFRAVDLFASYPTYVPPRWFDSTQFLVGGSDINSEWFVMQPFEGTGETVTAEQADQLRQTTALSRPLYELGTNFWIIHPSLPDTLTRAFLVSDRRREVGRLYINDPNTYQIYDTCLDLKHGYAISPTGDQVAIGLGGKDGFVYVLDLNDWRAYRLDLASNPVVAWAADP